MLTSSRSTPMIWHKAPSCRARWRTNVQLRGSRSANRNLLGWRRRKTATQPTCLNVWKPTGSFQTTHRGVLTFSRETVLIHPVPKARRTPSCLVERLGVLGRALVLPQSLHFSSRSWSSHCGCRCWRPSEARSRTFSYTTSTG